MQVVIAVFADGDALALLVAAWTAAGLPPERLHIVVDARRIPPAVLLAARLGPLGGHRSLALWSPRRLPDKPRANDGATPRQGSRAPRHARHRRRRRRGLTLLARLVGGGERVEWEMHARALDGGHVLGIARLGRNGDDALKIARPLLACAHGVVRVLDID